MTPDDRFPPPARPFTLPRTLALVALLLAIVAALLVAGAGPAYRFGWVELRTAFRTLMPWGQKVAIAATVLALVALALSARAPGRRGLGLALTALLIGALTFFLPWNWRRGAGGVPPIHDITTDWVNPPPLVYSRALRDSLHERMNPWQYGGDTIAAQQREAYPDIRPVMLALPPDEAYQAAHRAAREMGWEITEANRQERRIEAADRTPWFGFVDDVVIRVSSASGVSRVDVRSVSRVGRGDMGLNAERIRKYVAKLRQDNASALAEES